MERTAGRLVEEVERAVRMQRYADEPILQRAVRRDRDRVEALDTPAPPRVPTALSLDQPVDRMSHRREVPGDESDAEEAVGEPRVAAVSAHPGAEIVQVRPEESALAPRLRVCAVVDAPEALDVRLVQDLERNGGSRLVQQDHSVRLGCRRHDDDKPVDDGVPFERQRVGHADRDVAVARLLGSEHRVRRLECVADEPVGGLEDAIEARAHLPVYLVDAAAAYGVVGMVLEQEFPCVVEEPLGILTPEREVRVREQWLQHVGERRLRFVVGLLDRHPRRPDARQYVVVAAPQKLSLERVQARLLRTHRVHVVRQPGVPERRTGERVLERVEDGAEVLLRRQVVGAVHEQHRVDVRRLRGLLEYGAHLLDREVRVHVAPSVRVPEFGVSECRRVAVSAALVDREHFAPVRCAPQILVAGVVQFVPVAPRVHERINAGPHEDLRHLRDVPERVRHVADLLDRSQRRAYRAAQKEIPYGRLRAHEKLIGEDVPWPDRDRAVGDAPGQPVPVIGRHFEEVLDDDRLAVQQEVAERTLAVERVQHELHRLDEMHAELVEGQIPLAVPVRVRDHERAAGNNGALGRRSVGHSTSVSIPRRRREARRSSTSPRRRTCRRRRSRALRCFPLRRTRSRRTRPR